jgi:hypothetical protein
MADLEPFDPAKLDEIKFRHEVYTLGGGYRENAAGEDVGWLLKELNKARAYLDHIAGMLDCHLCGRYFKPQEDDTRFDYSLLCSKHRHPILMANGWKHGWTDQGGMPRNMVKDE